VDDGWVAVGPLEQLEDQRAVRVDVDGQPVMLARDGERFFAVASRCTHQGASLQRGPLKFGAVDQVTCPVHGSVFGLADGRVLRGPAMTPLRAYEVRVTDGRIEVRPRP
jgi:nitrite reductase/ring-hydroxylating ferredoxin subunit